jgi:hypothetical protein
VAGIVLVPLFTPPDTERLPYYADEYRPW